MGALKDLTGNKFGRLVVVKRVEDYVSPSGIHKIQWLCKCDCGSIKKIAGEYLRNGTTKSCGCLNKERAASMNYKHGYTSGGKPERLFGVWCGMKQRCYDPNHDFYHRYGALGITVCEEWLLDYKAFRKWAYNNGYDENAKLNQCTIDRIDSSKGYSPDNCRWVNQKVQSNGLCTNRILTYYGQTHTMSQWADILKMDYEILHSRIEKGWDTKRAFEQPVRRSCNHEPYTPAYTQFLQFIGLDPENR